MSTETAYDVVVCGCGGAGAAAAIEAHDAGASVIVLEKALEPGGSTRESGGSIATLVDPAGAVEHYLALTEGLTPRPVIEAYVAGVEELQGWIERNGGRTRTMQMRMPAFPHRVAGSAYADRPCAEAIGSRVRFHEPGVTNGGSALWRFLERNLEQRRIPVLYGTPVLRLCRIGAEIAGVEASVQGRPATFTARRGVVLATGGFGANGSMVRDSVGVALPPLGPAGRNTGDGVRMAQAVGADLWHMNCVAAGFGYLVPEHASAFMATMSSHGFFLVDGNGRRYLDELSIEHHAAAQAMLVRDYRTGRLPRLPSYLIFDERTRLAGRIATDEAGANREIPWADDNSDAIERGWVRRAASIEALAAELSLPELVPTARAYNAAAASGDDSFGRARTGMWPVADRPFYGIAIWPALFNTQGGPRRNESAQVVDAEGEPIPASTARGSSARSGPPSTRARATSPRPSCSVGSPAGTPQANRAIQAHNGQEYPVSPSFALGFPFDPSDVDGFMRLARTADEGGIEMVSTGDTPVLLGDLYVGLTLIAQSTSRCRVASFITNPLTRHPVVAASAIASVDAISGGRAMLGISSGDSGVLNLGLEPARLGQLEEYIRVVRELWSSGKATYQGRQARLTWARRRIPVYMGPGGPAGLRLAGRVADGRSSTTRSAGRSSTTRRWWTSSASATTWRSASGWSGRPRTGSEGSSRCSVWGWRSWPSRA